MIDPDFAQRVLDLLEKEVPIEVVIREGRDRFLTIELKDRARTMIEKLVIDSCVEALKPVPVLESQANVMRDAFEHLRMFLKYVDRDELVEHVPSLYENAKDFYDEHIGDLPPYEATNAPTD